MYLSGLRAIDQFGLGLAAMEKYGELCLLKGGDKCIYNHFVV